MKKAKAIYGSSVTRPFRVPGCIVVVLLWVTATAGGQSARAPSMSAVPVAEPAMSLPHRDILDPDAEARVPASAESSQELRRPAESRDSVSGEAGPSTGQTADAQSEDSRVVGRDKPEMSLWRLRDFLPLIIVLALIGLAAWVVKRYLPARRLVTGSGVLEIVARLPLNTKQNLALVKMGRQLILIGISPERVTTLCLVDDPDQVSELIGRIASRTRESSAFGQSLDQEEEWFDDSIGAEAPYQAGGGVRGLLEKVRRLSRSPLN